MTNAQEDAIKEICLFYGFRISHNRYGDIIIHDGDEIIWNSIKRGFGSFLSFF